MAAKASVLLPVYNAAPFIVQAVNSILEQSFRDFELLLFDDGSTDETLQILESFKDPRIRIYSSSENLGYLHHLNRGIEMAQGEYILRMDADDVAHPRRFEKQVAFMDAHPAIGLCGTWAGYLGEQGPGPRPPLTHEQIVIHLLCFTTIAHPTAIIRTAILREHGLRYDPAFYTAEDHELWGRMSACTRLANIPEVLLQLRRHPQSTSVRRREEQKRVKRRIREIHFRQLLGRPLSGLESQLVNAQLDFGQAIDFRAVERFFLEVRAANKRQQFGDARYLDAFLENRLLSNLPNGRPASWNYWRNQAAMLALFPGLSGPTRTRLFKRAAGFFRRIFQ